MKTCIQADLDDAGAFRRINENNSENLVCILHALAQLHFFLVDMKTILRDLCALCMPQPNLFSFWSTCAHHVRVFVFATLNGL